MLDKGAIECRDPHAPAAPAGDERLHCPACNQEVLARQLLPVEGMISCHACVRASADRPWNPRTIAAISFLLGFGGAGVVHALNQKRLDPTKHALLRIVAWVAGFAALCLVLTLVPDGETARAGGPIGLGLNIGLAAFFARSGRTRFDAYVAAGGEQGKWYSAAGIALFVLVSVFALVLVPVVVYQEMRFEEGVAAFEAGDPSRAQEIFTPQCDLEDSPACVYLGVIAEQRAEYETANRYYRRACELENGNGCSNLGLAYEAGRGVTADLEEARRLHRQACDLGEPFGCQNLARLP